MEDERSDESAGMAALARSVDGAAGAKPGARQAARRRRDRRAAQPADLSRIPVLRKSELAAMQRAAPPFGGIAATAPGRFKRLFASPGAIFEPQDHGDGLLGRGAGARRRRPRRRRDRRQLLLLPPHPRRRIMESGAHALGCAVIPAGPGNTEQTLQAIAHLGPTTYCGPPDFLKILLDKAGEAGLDVSSIRKALVSGAALPPSLRAELERRGVKTRQAYATAELGVIAYETDAADGAVAPGLMVSDARAARNRDAGRGRSRRRGQGRRGRSHPPGRQLSLVALRHRRPLGLPARFARRGARASRAGWGAPIRRPRSRACSSIPRRSSKSANVIPSSARCG